MLMGDKLISPRSGQASKRRRERASLYIVYVQLSYKLIALLNTQTHVEEREEKRAERMLLKAHLNLLVDQISQFY